MMEALAIGLAAAFSGGVVGWITAKVMADREWEARRRGTIRMAADMLREMEAERDALRAQIAAFDRDGNGKIGGSKPRGKG